MGMTTEVFSSKMTTAAAGHDIVHMLSNHILLASIFGKHDHRKRKWTV